MELSAVLSREKNKKKRKLIFDKSGVDSFAIQLKKIRQQRGYTQSQLAFEANISLSQIARIETSKINPTLSTIIVIARTLEISLKDLFDFEIKN